MLYFLGSTPVDDRKLYQIIDFILNHAESHELDVIRAALRRREGGDPTGGGTTLGQMMRISAGSYGLPAFIVRNCDIHSLKAAIVNGWPPILTYRSTGKTYHAVVAVGYDDKRNVMIVHDPNYTHVRKIKYYDLGGTTEDGVQRFACLVVLPAGADDELLMRGLEKYVPKKITSKLIVSSLIPM